MPDRTLILASGSPARLRLLREAGFDPKVVVSGVSEDDVVADDKPGVTRVLAERKASAVADPDGDAVVIGCDSIIGFGPHQSGTPSTAAEALGRLRAMSGHPGTLYSVPCVIAE